MENAEWTIKDEKLTIVVDLTRRLRPSSSGRSHLIASSGGNLRLVDSNGYRLENINLTVSIPYNRAPELMPED